MAKASTPTSKFTSSSSSTSKLPAPASVNDRVGWITQTAFVLAIVLLLSRATLSEVVRDPASMNFDLKTLLDTKGPGPTTTLLLDLLCWLPTLLVLLRRLIDRTYTLRLCQSHAWMLLLGGWVAASCFWASDRFAAVVTASSFCAALSMCWAMSQLVRSWTRFRFVCAVMVGLLLIFIAQAAIYRYMDLPDTLAGFDQMQQQAADGTVSVTGAPDGQPSSNGAAGAAGGRDPLMSKMMADQMRKNLLNGSMLGFFKSPNVFAAALVLTLLVTIGRLFERVRRKADSGEIAALAIIMIAGGAVLYFTQSRTAWGGLIICLTLLAITLRYRGRIAAHFRKVYWFGLIAAVCVVGGVIATGLLTGGLLHDSLTFRWRYWVAAYHIFLDHIWLGVGWSSFADAYLPHRLPIAAEEIKDPHNVFVRFATETGLIGLVISLGFIIRAAWESTRPVTERAGLPMPTKRQPLAMILAVTGGYLLLRLTTGWPLSVSGTEPIKIVLFGIVLCFGMILAVLTLQTKKPGHVTGDNPRTAEPNDTSAISSAPVLLTAAVIGIGGMLLHAQVDFVLSENGTLLLALVLLGSIIGLRHPGAAGKTARTRSAVAAFALTAAAIATFSALIVYPIARAEALAAEALATSGTNPLRSAELYAAAYQAAPVANVDYPAKAAEVLQKAPASPKKMVMVQLARAIEANPADAHGWLNRARYRRTSGDADFSRPVDVMSDYLQFIARNPNDIPTRLEYAEYLHSVGRTEEAVKQFSEARRFDGLLTPDEPRRVGQERFDEVRKYLGQPG